jgi:hypothetical protein
MHVLKPWADKMTYTLNGSLGSLVSVTLNVTFVGGADCAFSSAILQHSAASNTAHDPDQSYYRSNCSHVVDIALHLAPSN